MLYLYFFFLIDLKWNEQKSVDLEVLFNVFFNLTGFYYFIFYDQKDRVTRIRIFYSREKLLEGVCVGGVARTCRSRYNKYAFRSVNYFANTTRAK